MIAADTDYLARGRLALAAWGLGDVSLARVPVGLINRTFIMQRRERRWVLQWVNPIFGASVHEDIEAITAHLEACGITTPRLVRTSDGALYTRDPDFGWWRVLTFIDGVTHDSASSPAVCESAGRLVGRFHAALAPLRYVFQHRRLHAHDTARYLAHLEDVLARGREHRSYEAVLPVGREILARGADLDLPSLARLPARIVHGDLKLSNVVFSPAGEALALIDLDTLAEMNIGVELGDAWRSWCNPYGEEGLGAQIDLDLLAAALRGYASGAGGLLSAGEIEALPTALATITLELAARFCADAIDESYFGWDRSRFPSASEHNLRRARALLALARSIASARPEINRLVQTALCRRQTPVPVI